MIVYETHTMLAIGLPVERPPGRKEEVQPRQGHHNFLVMHQEKGVSARLDSSCAQAMLMSDKETILSDLALAMRIIRTKERIDEWTNESSGAEAEMHEERAKSDFEKQNGVETPQSNKGSRGELGGRAASNLYSIGSLIYRVRRYYDVSREALAELTNIDVETLFAIELGRAPDWVIDEHIEAISNALGADIRALYDEYVEEESA